MISGAETAWEDFDINVWQHKLETVKAVLTQTNITKDIGNMIIC